MPPLRRSVLLLAFVVGGCGINMRYVVESDMRFEHCYRIDEDRRVAPIDKRACWQGWVDQYSHGQDQSRVSYAAERLRALDPNRPVSADPAYGAACPKPTSAYAPPPAVVAFSASVSISPEASASAALQSCTDFCIVALHTCTPSCGGEIACKGTCDASYRACMARCLH